MKSENNDGIMTVYLNGEIDHHTAGTIRNEADMLLVKNNPYELILDFSGVTFMDSSGVGLVIGRYKRAAMQNCRVAVRGLKDRDRKILMMSGLQNKIEFR